MAASIYYVLPRTAERIFGFSEISYRIPSVLAMLAALLVIAKITARLIHPNAAWFAVFVCFALGGINYQAADARPYALATLVAVVSVWQLIRWLDGERPGARQWVDASLFVIAAALLWRVHLILWPMYIAFALYAAVRLARRDTNVGWMQAGLVFAALSVSLIPVLMRAIELNRHAASHVIAPMPHPGNLIQTIKVIFIGCVCAIAALIARWRRWPAPRLAISAASVWLILAWWLCQPLSLYLFSMETGHSVFLNRYLYMTLPGIALLATLVFAMFVPARNSKPLTALFGAGVLLVMGHWNHWSFPHHNSDWRAAAAAVNRVADGTTPVICPSPFIEAGDGVWRPDYPVSSFLYSHLLVYRLGGRQLPFPFITSPQTEVYASSLTAQVLSQGNKFAIYGSDEKVKFWQRWFAARTELEGWSNRRLGPFDDVEVALFENPEATRITSK